MSEVSALIDTFKTGTYTVTSYAAGDYTTSPGSWTEGATSTASVKASVQPFSGRAKDELPEGARTNDARYVFTETALTPTDDAAGTNGDTLVIDGEVFEVKAVDPWGGSILPHWRATAVRRGYGA